MKKRALLALGFVLLTAAGACTNSGTAPDEIARPAFDSAPADSSGVGGGDGGRGTGWGGSGS